MEISKRNGIWNYIHNKSDASPKTSEKIFRLIAGYSKKPDRIARSLSLKSRKLWKGVPCLIQ